MTENYVRWVEFRLVLISLLLWAFVAPWAFGYLLRRLGWDTIGIEQRWTLFLAVSLVCLGGIAGAVFGVGSLFGRRQTKQSKQTRT